MKSLRFLMIAFAICSSLIETRAQDSIHDVEGPYVSFKNKPSFFLTVDRTNSLVSGRSAVTTELRAGLDFKRKVRLGIGIAGLVSDVVAPKNVITESNTDTTLNALLSMTYLTLSAEYTLYESKRWQITMPVMTGIGTAYWTYYEKVGNITKTKKLDEGGVLLTGPSVIFTYRIFRWIGVSGGLGYRQLIINNSKINESFNSPVSTFRIRIFMGEIYKSVFPRGIFGNVDPPYSNEYWD